jgi:hypothetical protein
MMQRVGKGSQLSAAKRRPGRAGDPGIIPFFILNPILGCTRAFACFHTPAGIPEKSKIRRGRQRSKFAAIDWPMEVLYKTRLVNSRL